MLPQLRELEHSFGPELAIIGVHSAKFPAEKVSANLRKAVLRNEIDHPVVNDADFAIWQSFTVRAWPTLMFIDPRGYVIGKHEGEFALAAVRDFLHGALAAFADELDRTPLALSPATEETATLRFPGKILADAERNHLVVADSGHHRVLLTDMDGNVQAVFGSGHRGRLDGNGREAAFTNPQGLALDPRGDRLYVADTGNHLLRAIDLRTAEVATVAGTGERGHGVLGGPGRTTALASPWDLVWRDDRLWIAMAGTHQLWTFTPDNGRVTVAAGSGHESIHDGPLESATFAQPSGITALDGLFYVADSETSAVRRVDPIADRVRRLVGRGLFEFGDIDAAGDSVRLQHPLGVAAAMENGKPAVYIADSYNDKIKRLDPETRAVTTIAGGNGHGLVDGPLLDAEFWEPGGLSLAGRTLYVADTNNHAIRAVDLDADAVRTIPITGA